MSLPEAGSGAVVVTGASSGIGDAIARGLARRGYPLVLVARRRERLEQLAVDVRETCSVPADVLQLDLTDGDARSILVRHLEGAAPAGLVNSAGFGTNGAFHTLSSARLSEEVTVNALALMELTHAALPGMIERGCGAVLNVASIAAFQPVPGAAVYAATKAFVQTFSEAVHEELRGTGVSCTALSPGPVPTEWWDIAGGPAAAQGMAALSPEAVAEAAITGMIAGKRSVVPGLVSKMAGLGGRLSPRALLLPTLRIASSRRR